MSEYTDTYLVLDCSVYPKAYIRIYRTEDDNVIQTIPVKWEARYEAFKQLYGQYIKSLNTKEK